MQWNHHKELLQVYKGEKSLILLQISNKPILHLHKDLLNWHLRIFLSLVEENLQVELHPKIKFLQIHRGKSLDKIIQTSILVFFQQAWIMEIVLIMVTVKTRTFLLGKKLVKQGLILTGKANSNQTAIVQSEDPK